MRRTSSLGPTLDLNSIVQYCQNKISSAALLYTSFRITPFLNKMFACSSAFKQIC